MSSIEQIVDDIVQGVPAPGVYRLRTEAHAATILEAFTARGWRAFYVDGSQIRDKAGFLAAHGRGPGLPRLLRPQLGRIRGDGQRPILGAGAGLRSALRLGRRVRLRRPGTLDRRPGES